MAAFVIAGFPTVSWSSDELSPLVVNQAGLIYIGKDFSFGTQTSRLTRCVGKQGPRNGLVTIWPINAVCKACGLV